MRTVFFLILNSVGLLVYGQDSSMVIAKLQQKKGGNNYQVITPINKVNILGLSYIEVSYDMTTHIVFPFDILYVDLGSPDIISQKADKVGNVLKLKANKKDFTPTNVTVITTDGQYFSFIASYAAFPKTLNINLHSGDNRILNQPSANLPVNNNGSSIALIGDVKMNEGDLNMYADSILKKRRRLHHIGEEKYLMNISIDNIYVKGDVIFMSCSLKNDSQVDYDINFIKFYVRDNKMLKRSAQQELEVTPLYTFDPQKTTTIAGKNLVKKVFCFQRFTIYDDKVFAVEIFEKNGGRKFSFNLLNEDIIRAKKI